MFDEIFAPLYTTEWGRRLGWGALITALLLLILFVGLMVYQWREDYKLAHTIIQRHSIQTAPDESKIIDALPSYHLFGHAQSSPKSMPITSLQLHLVGVIKAEPMRFSRVIISEGGNSGKVYQVGDTLVGGVTIHSITEDGVILENEGRFEKLPLLRTPLQFQGMPKPLLPPNAMQEE